MNTDAVYAEALKEAEADWLATVQAKDRQIVRLRDALREVLHAEGSEIPHNVAERARAALGPKVDE